MLLLAFYLLLTVINSTESDTDPLINEALVAEINKKASFWTASLKSSNLLKSKTDFEARLGAIPKETAVGGDSADEEWRPKDLQKDVKLPKDFDSRKQWPECPSISKVVDQGPCGGCWATAATSVAQDRYCIQNVGQENPHLSYNDVLTCSDAGSCGGGQTVLAYEYIRDTGVPTGTMRDEPAWEETCSPSPFELCNHHQEGTHNICPDSKTLEPPTCVKDCYSTSKQDYKTDRYHADKAWELYDAEEMMREIYYRGPISIAFQVYKDFYFYLNGIYEHVAGEHIGLHAVRLIGWGHDDVSGLDYWTLANSWDPDWGEEGFIRIKREQGYMGIGTDGAEACNMKIPPELQANVKQLRAEKAYIKSKIKHAIEQEKSRNREKEQEEDVGFLVWSVVAPRNILFALSTLGFLVVVYYFLVMYYELKKCFTRKRDSTGTPNYDAVPMSQI